MRLKMSSRIRIHFLVLLLILISGCAPVISPELRAKVDPSLTFAEVLQNPDAHKGKIVLWGGEIVQVIPQNGTTGFKVLQMPLGLREKPVDASASEGKFLVLVKQFIDLSIFQNGKKITVAGEIEGVARKGEIKSLSETDSQYPLILSKQIYLWKGFYSVFCPPPPAGSWWYNPSEQMLRF